LVHALIVDDDELSLRALDKLIQRQGFTTSSARSLAEAEKELSKQIPDLALIDLHLPDGSGLKLLDELREADVEIVMITGDGSVAPAVEAMQSGAIDYLTKPIDFDDLDQGLKSVRRTLELRREVLELREQLRSIGRFGRMVGRSAAMQVVYDLIARVAPSQATVFLVGETGTGKDLVAESIHSLSKRAAAPFIAINCGAVQEALFESELFGHERGSFTGATHKHDGYFERAHGGTLFLDEITETPPELQVKLLRVLETSRITRVGGKEEIEIDVRLVAATNRDPEAAVREGKLREDLYYRLMVFPIRVPALRERDVDVDYLASFFLDRHNQEAGTKKIITDQALEKLRSHHWPGNVRELRNVVERAFILSRDRVTADKILLAGKAAPTGDLGDDLAVRVGMSIAEAEKRLILATLEDFDGDKPRAAETLGISLKTLYNRLNRYEAEDGRAGEPGRAGAAAGDSSRL
jgi:DNA-binding NtrC family response regulator